MNFHIFLSIYNIEFNNFGYLFISIYNIFYYLHYLLYFWKHTFFSREPASTENRQFSHFSSLRLINRPQWSISFFSPHISQQKYFIWGYKTIYICTYSLMHWSHYSSWLSAFVSSSFSGSPGFCMVLNFVCYVYLRLYFYI